MSFQGVLEYQEVHKVDATKDAAIQYFLDRFYMTRISLRMLQNQHLLLYGPGADQKTNRIGTIDPQCKLKSVIREAHQNAAFLCEEHYDTSPDMELKGNTYNIITLMNLHNPGHTTAKNTHGKKVGPALSYPTAHLYHILFELFKNSMRATVETHSTSLQLPPVEVLLSKGEHDVSIRISDQVPRLFCFSPLLQGGGIPRHITDHTFNYLVSTAPRPSFNPDKKKAPMAGYGELH